ncbi:MAG: hypothetical protein K6L81_09665 [Agarilytica sp.]
MKYLVIVLCLVAPALWAEGKPLDKAVVQSFYATVEKIDMLEDKFPQIFEKADKFSMADQEKAIRLIEKSKAYPDVKKALANSGFKDLNELYDISMRFMGAIYAVQLEKMPAGVNPDAMTKSLEHNIKLMKESGAPAQMITGMEASLAESRAQSKDMAFAMSKASDADNQFVRNNLAWVMTLIPDEDEEDGMGGTYSDEDY